MSFVIQQIYRRVFHVDDIKVLSLTLLNLTVTVSGILLTILLSTVVNNRIRHHKLKDYRYSSALRSELRDSTLDNTCIMFQMRCSASFREHITGNATVSRIGLGLALPGLGLGVGLTLFWSR